ncbi:hypothetical protein C1701_09840 [Actinoalloteichus sp. AHMU CJ021]|uniref:Uncharacterized protein n=1 Tax=Actinoalloteichus caeruleus DSM 43889 TaxID=1120930 RepID=A0ABT1JJU3_ACTCY|nr:hypothetical protein [Actinoalloteichus caeruleus]AUS78621.1 hypothetical protein C1701_09840 [Actinoalloteichus sp. AHMU CJ021]MCP2332752.1 hypothetical protein [Actinoalloteichus caeruleus DSM 43889]
MTAVPPPTAEEIASAVWNAFINFHGTGRGAPAWQMLSEASKYAGLAAANTAAVPVGATTAEEAPAVLPVNMMTASLYALFRQSSHVDEPPPPPAHAGAPGPGITASPRRSFLDLLREDVLAVLGPDRASEAERIVRRVSARMTS